MSLPTIYISGPITATETRSQEANVEHAMGIYLRLRDLGWVPYLPHYDHFLEQYCSINNIPFPSRACLLAHDFIRVEREDAFFRIGPSPGADQELSLAKRLGKPIFEDIKTMPHGVTFMIDRNSRYNAVPCGPHEAGPKLY